MVDEYLKVYITVHNQIMELVIHYSWDYQLWWASYWACILSMAEQGLRQWDEKYMTSAEMLFIISSPNIIWVLLHKGWILTHYGLVMPYGDIGSGNGLLLHGFN